MQRRIPAFPFDWDLFVQGVPGDCVPSCVAMCARYWKKGIPKLPIPDDPQVWNDFVRRTANVTFRGTSLRRLLRNMPSTEPQTQIVANPSSLTDIDSEPEDTPSFEAIEAQGLVLEPRLLAKPEDLLSFLYSSTAIPVIIVLDLGIAEMNRKWGQHAVLLHSVDLKQERKIYVIDPMITSMKEPRTLDLRRFEIGWKECQNMTIVVYPKDYATIKSSVQKGNLKITEFLSGGSQ